MSCKVGQDGSADLRASFGAGSTVCGCAWDAQYVGDAMRHGASVAAIPATNALTSAKYKALRNSNGLGRAIGELLLGSPR